jgi:light-regulated signal transduction histidine kinase (bacteriophytochrome)
MYLGIERRRPQSHGASQEHLKMQGRVRLLELTRATRDDMLREPLDLSAMAHAVAADLESVRPESRATFLISERVTANGDAELCRIVLDNLMDNAWKHSVSQVEMVIEFGMTELAGKPVYFVSDNGPCLDMAQAGKLFVPFQRIPGRDAEWQGTSLASVKRIVKRHGGRVWVESSPGEGETFFFTLE